MNGNQSLFFYGLWASCIQIFGVIAILIGLFSGSFGIFIIGLIVGIILILVGKSKRFDYKMQSGGLIHKGDWN